MPTITGLQTETVVLAGTDLFVLDTSRGTEKIKAENIAYNMAWGIEWIRIAAANYTAAPKLEFFKISDSSCNAISDWVTATAYTVGNFVKPTSVNGFIYQCSSAGTSGGTEPTWGTIIGATTADGADLVWRCWGLNVIALLRDLTSDLKPGMALKWTDGSGMHFGQIFGVTYSAGPPIVSRLIIAGAPLGSNSALTGLYYNPRGVVRVERFAVSGEYGDGAEAGLLAADMNRYCSWQEGLGCMVNFRMRHKTAAGTTEPYMNMSIGGNDVCLQAGGNGIQPSTSWVDIGMVPDEVGGANNALVSVLSNDHYWVTFGEALEVACKVADVGTHAANLSVEAVFLLQ